jgi:mannose-6-phosphate isomerase
LSALIAYPASRPIDGLLQRLGEPSANLASPVPPAVPQFAGATEERT